MRVFARTVVLAALAMATAAVTPGAAQQADSGWTIRGGRYAGETVAIDKAAATRRGGRFWRMSDISGQRRIVGWNPSTLPARVAFRDGRGINAADSVAFWSTLRQMEEDMGMRLFEPVTLESGSDPHDVIVIDVRSMKGSDGMTFVTWSSGGSLYDARVFFRSHSTFQNAHVVTHEMMHVLGFGHTSAWTSVMNGGAAHMTRLSIEDVAYAQYALAARVTNEREDMWARLALAVERDPPSRDLRDGYAPCPPYAYPHRNETATRMRGLAVPELLSAVGGCLAERNKGSHTITVDNETGRNP